jgi:geranylgeranyl reductase family protein
MLIKTYSTQATMKVLIVGAGPSGCQAAFRLAKEGHDVELLEEHDKVGLPIACTGIVTKALYEFVPRDKSYIINSLNSAKIVSKNNSVEVPLHEDVICRHKFDSWMANRAKQAGAKILTNYRFKEIKNNKAVFSNKGKEVVKEFDILVGADGPRSEVAKAANLWSEQDYWFGLQVTIEGDWKKDQFEAHFGKVCPGFFAWIVPESNKLARVGLAADKKAKPLFDEFLKQFKGEVVATQAGPIPWYKKRKASKDNIYLVGDAAGLTKATTGGGIITGIWSANVLADSLVNKTNYEKNLSKLRRELWIHRKIRSTLNKFKDKDYDKLIKLMSKDKVLRILRDNPREYPSRYLVSLLFAQPRLLSFAKFVFYR